MTQGALLIALALDLLLRELPNALHPVVWMGKLVSLLERIGPSAESKVAALAWGGFMAAFVPVLAGGLAWLAANGLRELGPIPYLVGVAALLSTTFAVKGLAQAAKDIQDSMDEGSMGEARHGLRSLVSRDANSLSQPLAAAAAIESVAENTTDSYIGPWLAFALLGLPGAFAFRAVNTLDSMIGYRGKYEYLGKASARLDDVMNLIPARISAGPDTGGGRYSCASPDPGGKPGMALGVDWKAVDGQPQCRLDHRRDVRSAGCCAGEIGALPHRRWVAGTRPRTHRPFQSAWPTRSPPSAFRWRWACWPCGGWRQGEKNSLSLWERVRVRARWTARTNTADRYTVASTWLSWNPLACARRRS